MSKTHLRTGIDRYSEDAGDEDDYSDVFGGGSGGSGKSGSLSRRGEKEEVGGGEEEDLYWEEDDAEEIGRLGGAGGAGGLRTLGRKDRLRVEELKLNERLSSRSWVRFLPFLSLFPLLPSISPRKQDRVLTTAFARPQLGDEDSDEDDPFALVDLEGDDLDTPFSVTSPSSGYFSEADLDANLARDKLAQQLVLVGELIETVGGAERLDGEFEVREAALQLVRLFSLSHFSPPFPSIRSFPPTSLRREEKRD